MAQDLATAALEYAAAGYRVFPCAPRGKAPLTAHGCKDATADAAQVAAWWRQWPDANIGIATGGGLMVFDLDAHAAGVDGTEWLADWQTEHGALPPTATVSTGGGGRHLYYLTDEEPRNAANAAIGVDVRGAGGYVIAPPSLHPSGAAYSWDNQTKPAQATPLVDELYRAVRSKPSQPVATDSQPAAASTLATIKEGGRNDSLTSIAGKLQACGVPDALMGELLQAVNAACCTPPLDAAEVAGIASSVCRRYDKGGLPPIEPADLDARPPLRPAIIEGVARAGALVLVSAPSKAGKTWLLMQLAIAFAAGDRWLGWQCKQGRVLYVDGELWRDEWLSRLDAIADRMAATHDAVRDGVDLLSLRGRARDLREMAPALIDAAAGGGYQAIIIDPAYIFMAGDENGAGDVRDFFNALARVGRACGCAVVISHHHSKGAKGDAAAIDRSSGSGVFGRYPDAILDLIEVVPPADADPAAYGLADGASAYRVTPTLRSFRPQPAFSCWFRPPVHVRDVEGVLDGLDPMTQARAGGLARGNQRRREASQRRDAAEEAIACEMARRGVDRLPTKDAQAAAGYSDRQTFTRLIDKSAIFGREVVRGKESYVVRRE